FVRAYAVSGGNTTYGAEVSFTTSAPIELISNGDFTGPSASVTEINGTTPWKTDGTDDNSIIGRSPETALPANYIVWQSEWAESIYQLAGTVPAVETTYKVALSGWYDYSYWHPGYDATVSVRFSAYTGSDPTTRVRLDS